MANAIEKRVWRDRWGPQTAGSSRAIYTESRRGQSFPAQQASKNSIRLCAQSLGLELWTNLLDCKHSDAVDLAPKLPILPPSARHFISVVSLVPSAFQRFFCLSTSCPLIGSTCASRLMTSCPRVNECLLGNYRYSFAWILCFVFSNMEGNLVHSRNFGWFGDREAVQMRNYRTSRSSFSSLRVDRPIVSRRKPQILPPW